MASMDSNGPTAPIIGPTEIGGLDESAGEAQKIFRPMERSRSRNGLSTTSVARGVWPNADPQS